METLDALAQSLQEQYQALPVDEQVAIYRQVLTADLLDDVDCSLSTLAFRYRQLLVLERLLDPETVVRVCAEVLQECRTGGVYASGAPFDV